ncbi:uncharacterized protein LACBIDRAFT_332033 [Laccaria bicolor S238N-H82]|uniref:Predicted protein n=1 Tax=Laccaria bicolor (strain S238N-H82 / ATCC MYA-4686) TaxID=486041 RepID=B0DRC3_LACBS|nr:uncharacterized protein LACBIDRAFT_332033 [Laccaria bicolor S238N-H82]EDR02843.1 predicted protein [Laccaria bicolor S238N-H82]|eukprot:XP_001886553.1 predicted protein [Laccaria bicolor S238N-H82]
MTHMYSQFNNFSAGVIDNNMSASDVARGITISGETFNVVAGDMATYDYHQRGSGTVNGQMHHGGTYDGSSHTYLPVASHPEEQSLNEIRDFIGVVNGQMHYGGHFRGDRVGEREDTRYNTSTPRTENTCNYSVYASTDDGPNPYCEAPKSSTYGQRQDASSQSSYPMGHGPPAIYPRYAPQPQMNSHAPYPMSTPYAAPSYSAPSTYANHPTAYSNSSSPPSHNQGSWCSFLTDGGGQMLHPQFLSSRYDVWVPLLPRGIAFSPIVGSSVWPVSSKLLFIEKKTENLMQFRRANLPGTAFLNLELMICGAKNNNSLPFMPKLPKDRGVTISGGTFNDVSGNMTTNDSSTHVTNHHSGSGTVNGQMHHGGTYDTSNSSHTHVGNDVNNIRNTSTARLYVPFMFKFAPAFSEERRRSSSPHAAHYGEHDERAYNDGTPSIASSDGSPDAHPRDPRYIMYAPTQDTGYQRSYHTTGYEAPRPLTSNEVPRSAPFHQAIHHAPQYANHPSVHAYSSYPPPPSGAPYGHASNPHASNSHAPNSHASYSHASNTHPSYPHPSYPQASYPQASYPQASYPQASYPQASYPQASYPQASYPRRR